MYGYIYKTTNLLNNKIYVGKKKGEFDPTYLGSGKCLRQAVAKYGKANFSVEIIEFCGTLQEQNNREKYWIKYLDAQNKSIGYNISPGGDGGDIVSCLSVEERNKFSEKIAKLNEQGVTGNKGKHLSDSHRSKISASLVGIKRSDETIEKHRKAIKGKTAWNKGLTKNDPRVAKYVRKKGAYKHTAETRLKISENIKHKERMGVYQRTDEQLHFLRTLAKGRIWINNGNETRMIYPEQLDYFIKLGYKKGRGKVK